MRRTNHKSGWLAFSAGIGALIVTTWGAMAQQQPPTRVDDNALKNASKTPDRWLTYGLDYAETRYSALKQIDTTNVSRLGLAWVAEIGAGGGGQEATPVERLLAIAAGLLLMFPATTTDVAGLGTFAIAIGLHFWRTRST